MRWLALVALAGCYSATIHLSPHPIVTPPTLPPAWHVSVLGIFELSDPVSLGVCPRGPVAIEENMALFGSLVAGFLGIEIMETAVVCEP